MNKNPRGSCKKIEFEPKIPQNAPEEPIHGIKKEEDSIGVGVQRGTEVGSRRENELVQQIKGMFAPKTLSKGKDGSAFNPELDSFILNLPATLAMPALWFSQTTA